MMQSEPDGARPSGRLYALVIYLPERLGRFLDDLRLEMVPDCNAHAHVSLLPPRPLSVDPEIAIQEARAILEPCPPFDVELGEIEKFDVTDVIYISIAAGAEQLRQMHHSLDHGSLAFREPFVYHPHVTLAQEIEKERVEELRLFCAQRWRAFRGPRGFRVETAVFVRNIRGNQWDDLATLTFRAAPAARRD